MGLIDVTRRIELGGGEWVEVLPLSAAEFRRIQKEAAQAAPQFDGDDAVTARNFELIRLLQQRIVAWSDPAPVTPENIERLPIELNVTIMQGMGAGAAQVPLPSGSPSTGSSTE